MKSIFLLFGAWLAYLNITSLLAKRRGFRQAKVAAQWPAISGKVLSSRIIEGRSRSSETHKMIYTYRPEVEFEYQAGGKTLKSQRLAFGKILFYQKTEADDFMTRHAEGAPVTVYHDPQQPAEAVLDRDPARATHLVIADCGLLGAGLALMGVGVYNFLATGE